jgi:hypothetical protein
MRHELVEIYDEIIQKINTEDDSSVQNIQIDVKQKKSDCYSYVEFASPVVQADRNDTNLKVFLKRYGNLDSNLSLK